VVVGSKASPAGDPSDVVCPIAYVATGGGTYCSGSAHLAYTEPIISQDGYTPIGWEGLCTTGKSRSYVTCCTTTQQMPSSYSPYSTATVKHYSSSSSPSAYSATYSSPPSQGEDSSSGGGGPIPVQGSEM
jgi:hypothetical protein